MHRDKYEFVSCVDDPLSAQIKYKHPFYPERLILKSPCVCEYELVLPSCRVVFEGKSGLFVAEACGGPTYSQVGQIQSLWLR